MKEQCWNFLPMWPWTFGLEPSVRKLDFFFEIRTRQYKYDLVLFVIADDIFVFSFKIDLPSFFDRCHVRLFLTGHDFVSKEGMGYKHSRYKI